MNSKSKTKLTIKAFRFGDRGLFFYHDSPLSTVFENASFSVFYRGVPSMDANGLQRLLEGYRAKKDKTAFTIETGSYLLMVYDKKDRVLRVYRDAWGTVPCYYHLDAYLLSDSLDVLASKIGSLRLNKRVIGEYLTCLYVAGKETLYDDIFSMEPLTMLEIKDDGPVVRSNHEFPEMDRQITEADMTRQIRSAIDRVIKNIAHDIPDSRTLFVALSGGTDSSLVCAKLREIYKNNFFHCGVVEYENWHRNDTAYYQTVVDRYQLKGNIQTINNRCYARALQTMLAATRYIYPTFAPSYHCLLRSTLNLYPEIKFHINGTGPDEAVIGFEKIPLRKMREYDKFPKRKWIDLLFREVDYFFTPPATIATIVNRQARFDILERRRAIAKRIASSAETFSEFQRRYAMQTITDHHIKMLHHIGVAAGVDTLYPYCTQESFRVLFAAPYDRLNSQLSYKYIFKKLLLKYFDRRFVFRPKIGFHAPSRIYFRQKDGLGKILRDLPSDSLRSLFVIPKVKKQIELRLTRDEAPMDYLLWTITNLTLWNQSLKEVSK